MHVIDVILGTTILGGTAVAAAQTWGHRAEYDRTALAGAGMFFAAYIAGAVRLVLAGLS